MNLSPHFKREEIERSDVAKRLGICNVLPYDWLPVWTKGCELLLEPIRALSGYPLTITSGFRCDALNEQINGSKNSQHRGYWFPTRYTKLTLCCAFDLESPIGNRQLFDLIMNEMANDLPVDQLINEFDFSWVHVSYCPDLAPRKQILEIG
jgi:zinc D-Ala-D-Ala carboxypeptidase